MACGQITKKGVKGEEGEKKKVVVDVDALANKDKNELMREQRELILDEQAEFKKRSARPPARPAVVCVGEGVTPAEL